MTETLPGALLDGQVLLIQKLGMSLRDTFGIPMPSACVIFQGSVGCYGLKTWFAEELSGQAVILKHGVLQFESARCPDLQRLRMELAMENVKLGIGAWPSAMKAGESVMVPW